MAAQRKYSAFISYSRADEPAVRKLYRRLTEYRLPRKFHGPDGSARLGRFFLDKEELGAAGELDEELYEKLDETERLIVCCSPAAARSKWVDAEARAFIERHGRGKLLAVVLDGEPHEAFPPSLLADEPLAADFRAKGDGEEHGFLKLVAGLLYVDLGELRDLQAKAERRRARIRNALVVVFATLAVVATVAAVIAVRATRRAEEMTAEAIDIGAGVVTKTDALSRKFGVPTSALEELLSFADERFTRLFDEGVRSDELARQQMGLLLDFSKLYQRVGQTRVATDSAERAVEILGRLPTQRSIDYVEALGVLGDARHASGDIEGATTAYRDAVVVARRMLADIPDGRLARNRLAAVLQRLGALYMHQRHPEEALPLFREAYARLEELAELAPRDGLAASNAIIGLNWVGSAQALSGDRDAAIETFQRAIGLAEDFLKATPDSLPALNALGGATMKLGQTLSEQGDFDGARLHLTKSASAARRLVDADPRDAEQQRDLALRLGLIGNLDFRKGRPQAAADSLRRAADVYEALVARDPTNTAQRTAYAQALAVEAEALRALGDVEATLDRRARAAELWASAVDAETEPRPARLTELARAYELLGDASAQARDLDRMLEAYGRAEPIRRRLRSLDDTPERRSAHATVLHVLGLTRKFAKRYEASARALREAAALRLALETAESRFAAADSLQQLALVMANIDGTKSKAHLVEARAILERLLADDPDNAAYQRSLKKTNDVLALFE